MSIRRKPEEAVPLLLARLDKVKKLHATTEDANEFQSLTSNFGAFEKELEQIKDVVPHVKRWERWMVRQFCDLEKELDKDMFKDPQKKSEVAEKLERMTEGIKKLREYSKKAEELGKSISEEVKPKDQTPTDDDHQTVCPEWVELGVEKKILESNDVMSFLGSFRSLSGSPQAKMCSLCLSVFPTNSIIEKKPLIYWWMGEGFVMRNSDKTAEEVGEQVFQELVAKGFIRPSNENKSLSVKSFVIDPWIHRVLIWIAKDKFFCEFNEWTPCNGKRRAFLYQESDASHITRISGDKEAEDLKMVFNVNKKYLGMKPEWLSKLRKVEVLQMGRWHNSVTHHIEVEDQTLFNALGSQKHLKYLSLRGISRIESLPDSISKLISLQILDLRACHNLEKLPPTMSRLKKLTHLDVSRCYLLESMPKGLEQLVALEVLKGFVIGKAEKNSCKITDLTRLENLRKLSIRLGNQGETQQDDQLGSLNNLSTLRILTISWGDVSSADISVPPKLSKLEKKLSKLKDISLLPKLTKLEKDTPLPPKLEKDIPLPPKLTKLVLRCVPFKSVPEWLSPSKLPSDLDKLYIKGGKLKSLKIGEGKEKLGKVRYLRLKYLDDLQLKQGEPENYTRLDKFDCYEFHPDMTSTRAIATPETVDPAVGHTKTEELPKLSKVEPENYKLLDKFDSCELRPDIVASTRAADTPETVDSPKAQTEREELPKLNEVEPENYKHPNKFNCCEICPDITSTRAADTPEAVVPRVAQSEIEELAD